MLVSLHIQRCGLIPRPLGERGEGGWGEGGRGRGEGGGKGGGGSGEGTPYMCLLH